MWKIVRVSSGERSSEGKRGREEERKERCNFENQDRWWQSSAS